MDVHDPPRLMISKIVCENFKSYAGTQVLGPFHKCFSSVVGPNGSGKSNMIDAMLFVFGYRAAKIRSKKVSVLIHKSDQHRDLQSCRVSVHFQKILDSDDPDLFTVVPDSQFVVSRTAHLDNTSVYHLNDRRSQFKEIAALLKQSGIDLDHNRFLILQGEVEQIALMKPLGQHEGDEGLLEFLEDVIGSSGLKEPIQERSKAVDALNEARGDKVNRVKAVEAEKNDLEAAKAEAEEYLALQREVAWVQSLLCRKYILECGNIEAQAQGKRDRLEEQISPLKVQLQTLREEARVREKDMEKRRKQYEKLLEAVEGCKAALVACEQRDVSARQELKDAKLNLKKVEKNLEKEKEKLKALEEAPERCRVEAEAASDRMEVLEAQREIEERKLSEVLSSLREATRDLQEEKEAEELQLVSLNQAVNRAKAKVDMAQAELDLFNERSTTLQRQLEEARVTLETTRARIKTTQEGMARVKRDLPVKKKELSSCESEVKSLGATESKLVEQVRQLKAQVEEGKASLDAFKSRGKVLQSLLQQRDSGAIPGVCGRLGDLGTIGDKYDVAISTACSALDNIVVDTMETAVLCVQHLKSSGAGSATFIGLDKVAHLHSASTNRPQVPENVPRLYDLVKPKESRFAPAFFFALRNTLVASDLDQATSIAMKGKTRHRVVTLSGQLIDSSGTMSGGGGRVAKGRMTSRAAADVPPQQVEERRRRLRSDEVALEECTQRKEASQERLRLLKKQVAEMEKELKVFQVDDKLLGDQEAAVVGRAAQVEASLAGVEVDPAALKALEEAVAGCRTAHQKEVDRAAVVQGKVQRLNDRIMEAGGSKVKTQQAKVDGIVKETDACRAEITKAGVTVKTSARNASKCSNKIASLQKDKDGTEQSISFLRGEMKALEGEALEVMERHKQQLAQAKSEETYLKGEKSGIEQAGAEEVRVEGSLMDLCHEQDKYSAKLKENRNKIKHFQGQMAKLDLGEDSQRSVEEEELAALDTKKKEYEVTIKEERLKQMSPNMAAIGEYRKKEQLYQQRLEQLEALTAERDSASRDLDAMRKSRLDQFMAGFKIITMKLKEMYQMITLGGDAELELVDSLDPFSEGIVFSVRPPKKSWKNISNLSGGEKTLSSLALVFALHHYKPSPFYVMDEIDAALDYRNVSIIAHYIKERTKNAQFIIISLRNNMFELADLLVGIYKTRDATKSVAIKPRSLAMPSQPLKERN